MTNEGMQLLLINFIKQLIADYLSESNNPADVKAQNDLINCNLRFIFSVASTFAKGDEVLDLVSAATIGAIDAIQSFDESLGTTFLSYAVHYMRLGISEYFAMESTLPLSLKTSRKPW